MIDIISVEQCTLCGSCYNACPVNAISFKKAYLDFQYPTIDMDRCIGCGRCEKACPLLADKCKPEPGYPVAFAARSKSEEVRLHSSSGGVFYELAYKTLSDSGYVCGAVFDEQFHVKHIVSDTQEDLERMMGSKYAQSDMGFCYREIKKKLDDGKKVLFTSCPCQVAGLRTYLGKDYPNLLLVELICHGIPSDSMLQTYIGMQEKKYRAKLKRLEFRNKDKGWHNSFVRMEFCNNCIYTESIGTDAYMNGFLGNVILKQACYNCDFHNSTAGSDIIVGDFWGAETELTEEDDNKGLSAVIVNTEKGLAALKSCAIVLIPTTEERIIKHNMNLIKSPSKSPQRNEFYGYAEVNGYEAAIQRFLKEKFTQKLKRHMKYRLRCVAHMLRREGKPLY